VAPAFTRSAAQTGPINRLIQPISPQAEVDREDLGPEWTEGVMGLLCRRQVENKRQFVGARPCGPIFGHLSKFKF
jgi:hypothetical protein